MRFGSVVPSIICQRRAVRGCATGGERYGEKSHGNRMGCAQGAAALDPSTRSRITAACADLWLR